MWSIIISSILSGGLVAVLLKIFPQFMFDAATKYIEHKNNLKLEEAKADFSRVSAVTIEKLRSDLNANYSTIKSSVDFLSSSQKEYRVKMISATENLWNICIKIKNEFSDVVHVCDILTSDELKDAIENGSHTSLINRIQSYKDKDLVVEKFQRCDDKNSDSQRLFVSPKLWLIFFTLRSLHGRVGYKIGESLRDKKYYNWKKDSFLLRQLKILITDDYLSAARDAEVQGLQMIILKLEFEFILESGRIMSGAQPLSERISDMQKILLVETQKIGEPS